MKAIAIKSGTSNGVSSIEKSKISKLAKSRKIENKREFDVLHGLFAIYRAEIKKRFQPEATS